MARRQWAEPRPAASALRAAPRASTFSVESRRTVGSATRSSDASGNDGEDEKINARGALPLLGLGGFLLAYGVFTAIQEASVPGHRLELWELIVGVGVTILAAGIFSLFFAEETENPTRPAEPERLVGASSARVPVVAPPPPARAPRPTTPVPPWWEGPPGQMGRAPPRAVSAPYPRARAATGLEQLTSLTPPPARPVASAVGRPSPRLPQDVADALEEWATIAHPTASSWPRSPTMNRSPRAPRCADCERPLPADRPNERCTGCARLLCEDCLKALRSNGQPTLCLECLGRLPSP